MRKQDEGLIDDLWPPSYVAPMTDAELFDREVVRLGLGRRLLHTCDYAECAYGVIRLNSETLISSARQHLPKLPPIYFHWHHGSGQQAPLNPSFS